MQIRAKSVQRIKRTISRLSKFKSGGPLAGKLKVRVGEAHPDGSAPNGLSQLEIEHYIERYEEAQTRNLRAATLMFEATGNVAAAWLAFSTALDHGLPIPESVNAEIGRFAGKIGSLAIAAIGADTSDNLSEVKPAEVARIWRGKGGPNPFANLQREYRDYKVFLAIRDRVDHHNMKLIEAIEAVKSEGIIPMLEHEALKKIWKRYRKTHRNRPSGAAG